MYGVPGPVTGRCMEYFIVSSDGIDVSSVIYLDLEEACVSGCGSPKESPEPKCAYKFPGISENVHIY